LSDWLRLLCENRFAVSPSHLVRAASASASILANTAIAQFERMRYGAEVEKTTIKAPLFILGHWRSGTTYLHKLLALDGRFAFPNLYQVSLPHIFLSDETAATFLTRFQLPRTRPFDNVRQTWEMPNEDEIATATLSLRSPYLGGVFPQRIDDYDGYLTFRDVPMQETDEWRAGFLHFLKKLTWKYQRPLVLKSPPHSCRVRLLLDLFPESRFVHIHRNPYTVFQSTIHMIERTFRLTRLQRSAQVDFEARTLRVYREMYERFFEERSLIPDGHFHEVCFEEVERDPIGPMRNIYEALDLPAFAQVESGLQAYVSSTVGYKKNEFPKLSPDLRERIASEWQRYFDEWRYPNAGDGNG
jgi:hypothetical protein